MERINVAIGTSVPLVVNCARCGKKHEKLKFKKLTRPIETASDNWTHWAPCPCNKQPILMLVKEAE